jgi:hypothetical protein
MITSVILPCIYLLLSASAFSGDEKAHSRLAPRLVLLNASKASINPAQDKRINRLSLRYAIENPSSRPLWVGIYDCRGKENFSEAKNARRMDIDISSGRIILDLSYVHYCNSGTKFYEVPPRTNFLKVAPHAKVPCGIAIDFPVGSQGRELVLSGLRSIAVRLKYYPSDLVSLLQNLPAANVSKPTSNKEEALSVDCFASSELRVYERELSSKLIDSRLMEILRTRKNWRQSTGHVPH